MLLLKHVRNCRQLSWNRNFSLVGTWIIRGAIENFIPAIWSACTAHVFLSLIRAQKAVYINQPQDGNLIVPVLVYNAAFHMVQSLSLTVYNRLRKGMPLPCPLIARLIWTSESYKKHPQPFFSRSLIHCVTACRIGGKKKVKADKFSEV